MGLSLFYARKRVPWWVYPSLYALPGGYGDTLTSHIPWFVGPLMYTGSVAHPVRAPCVHRWVDKYALLASLLHWAAFVSQNSKKEAKTDIIDRKGGL